MACSVPICYLLHLVSGDGAETMLMEPDLSAALADALADPSRRAMRVTFGRQVVLEGPDLEAALRDAALLDAASGDAAGAKGRTA